MMIGAGKRAARGNCAQCGKRYVVVYQGKGYGGQETSQYWIRCPACGFDKMELIKIPLGSSFSDSYVIAGGKYRKGRDPVRDATIWERLLGSGISF